MATEDHPSDARDAERGAPRPGAAWDAWPWRLATVPGLLLMIFLAMGLCWISDDPGAGNGEARGWGGLGAGAFWAALIVCTWLPGQFSPVATLIWAVIWGGMALILAGLAAVYAADPKAQPTGVGWAIGTAASAVIACLVWSVATADRRTSDPVAADGDACPASGRRAARPGHVGWWVVGAFGLVVVLAATASSALWLVSPSPGPGPLVVGFAVLMGLVLCAVVMGLWSRTMVGRDVLFWRVLWAATMPRLLLMPAAGPQSGWRVWAPVYLALAASQLLLTWREPATVVGKTDGDVEGSVGDGADGGGCGEKGGEEAETPAEAPE